MLEEFTRARGHGAACAQVTAVCAQARVGGHERREIEERTVIEMGLYCDDVVYVARARVDLLPIFSKYISPDFVLRRVEFGADLRPTQQNASGKGELNSSRYIYIYIHSPPPLRILDGSIGFDCDFRDLVSRARSPRASAEKKKRRKHFSFFPRYVSRALDRCGDSL